MRKPDEPRKDPLAELARVIGDDSLYADLLRLRTRGPEPVAVEAPPPRIVHDEDDDHIPAMPLRGDERIEPHFAEQIEAERLPAVSLNWDELERDLAHFAHSTMQEAVASREAPPAEQVVDDYQPQMDAHLPQPIDEPLPQMEPEWEPEPQDDDWSLRGFSESEPAYEAPYQPTYTAPRAQIAPDNGAAAFDDVNESIGDVVALAEEQVRAVDPVEEFERFVQQSAADKEAYDFEQRAASILEDERASQQVNAASQMMAGVAGTAAAASALAAWDQREERLPPQPQPRVSEAAMRRAMAEAEPQFSNDGHLPQHQPHVFPEDAPRRNGGLATIGAVLGITLLGVAGVAGYRMLAGGPTAAPKVVRADPAPLKVPAAQESTNVAAKTIVDRMESGKDKVVPREEQPLSAAAQADQLKPPQQPMGLRVIPLSTPAAEPLAVEALAPAASAAISAPVPTQPSADGDPAVRSVKTIAISGPSASQATPLVTEAPKRVEAAEPVEPGHAPVEAGLPLPRPAGLGEARKVKTVQIQPDGTIASRPQTPVAPSRSANSPLSINPQDQPARTARAETPVAQPPRAAPQAAAPAPSGGGNAVVQITSVKTDAEARQAFTRLQGKYGVLSGYSPNIRAVDLGSKGIYHRVRVGPMNRANADDVCRQIKASGGDCIVQAN